MCKKFGVIAENFSQKVCEVSIHYWWKWSLIPLLVLETATQTQCIRGQFWLQFWILKSLASHTSHKFTCVRNGKMAKLATSCCQYCNVSTRMPCVMCALIFTLPQHCLLFEFILYASRTALKCHCLRFELTGNIEATSWIRSFSTSLSNL